MNYRLISAYSFRGNTNYLYAKCVLHRLLELGKSVISVWALCIICIEYVYISIPWIITAQHCPDKAACLRAHLYPHFRPEFWSTRRPWGLLCLVWQWRHSEVETWLPCRQHGRLEGMDEHAVRERGLGTHSFFFPRPALSATRLPLLSFPQGRHFVVVEILSQT